MTRPPITNNIPVHLNQARFLPRNILERIPRQRLGIVAGHEDKEGSVTSEDDDGSPQHLEGAGVGESQADVLKAGRRHVAQSRWQEDLNIDSQDNIAVLPLLPGD